MPGLLDFFTSPTTALAAGLLTPSPQGTFGGGLQQGIAAALQAERSAMRQQLLKAELMKWQQQQQAAQARQTALGAITQQNQLQGPRRPQFQGQPLQQASLLERDPAAAARQMISAGDFEGGLQLMRAFGGDQGQIGSVSPSSFTPDSVAKFQTTGNYADLVPVPKSPLVSVNTAQPMSVSDLMKFRDPQGNPPPVGATVEDLKSGGFKMASTAEQTQYTGTKGALSFLDELEALAFDPQDPVFTEFSGVTGRTQAGIQNARDLAAQNPNRKNLVLYNDLAQGGLSIIVRALGEKGTLAEGDVKRIRNVLPKAAPLPDSPQIAREKMKTLRGIINEIAGRKPNSFQKMVEVNNQIYVIGADGQARPLLEK
jgi:hypothetical protein